jgi:hypothetical protein
MKKYEPTIGSISDPEVYSWICGDGGNRATRAKVYRKRVWSALDTTTVDSGKLTSVGGLKTFRDCQKLCDRLNAKNKKGKTMLSEKQVKIKTTRIALKLIRAGFHSEKEKHPDAVYPFLVTFKDWQFDVLEECISSLDEIYENKKRPSAKVARAFHKVRNLATEVSFGRNQGQPTLWIRVGDAGINHSRQKKKQFRKNINTMMRSLCKFLAAEDAWGTDQADEPSDTVLRVWWEPYV